MIFYELVDVRNRDRNESEIRAKNLGQWRERRYEMTREIIFRGKRVRDGRWVYGSLIDVEAEDFCCILTDDIHPMDYPYLDGELGVIDGHTTPVKRDTVGQWTGLIDKNGIKIFEGDIVSFEQVEVVRYSRGGFSPFSYPGWDCTPDPEEVEVIGNIHDNPNLVC